MTPLAERVARSAGRPLVRAPEGELRFADAVRLPVAGCAVAAPRPARVAFSLRSARAFVRALLMCDGTAEAILLLAPTLGRDDVQALMADAGCAILVSDRADLAAARSADQLAAELGPAGAAPAPTQWLMTTSGTTGRPKIVSHTLDGLARMVKPPLDGAAPPLWGLLSDPTRFAALQVVLQSLIGGGVLLAPDRERPWAEQMAFLSAEGCTHLATTPTLLRKVLMSGEDTTLPLRRVTLGGEIVDDSLLAALAARYPDARVGHLYGATEVGVGFSVRDGRAGFPARLLEEGFQGVRFRIVDGVLWVRPPEGERDRPRAAHVERDADGFLRTGDHVKTEGDRVFFTGREDGAVNVGGVKLQPEAIEQIVLQHPGVAACAIVPKRSPLMGAVLTFDIAPRTPPADAAAFVADLRRWLRGRLQREAQPASIRLIDEIGATSAGKTSRRGPT